MKKTMALLLTLSMIALFGYGCDDNGVCTESGGYVYGTSDTELYYPCSISGTVGATTMSAGYTQTLNNVDWLSERLAEEGFVVLAFTPTNTLGFVSGWRDAHKNAIDRIRSINSTHSTLRGKIDEGKLQTCGHSKGGGGSLWASSQLQGALKTTVGMAPYREEFLNSTLGSITAATFVQAGGSDTLATNSMTRGEYDGLGDISKMYVEYTGYGHLAWDGASGSTADRIAGDIIAWMRYYMDGDTSYASTLSNTSGTSRHEWVDKIGGDDGDDGNTGCN